MVVLGDWPRLHAREAILAVVVLTSCGGRSVKEEGRDNDARGHGGTSGTAGTEAGVPTGGFSGAGDSGPGGTQSAGGSSSGGIPSTGGSPAGGARTTGGTSAGGSAGYGWDTCPEVDQTTISGTVTDPSGRVPVYNAIVFVPSGPLEPMPEGARCDGCAAIVPPPVMAALSDTQGRFRLSVPSGRDVPIAIQVGRWRRELTLPVVRPCVDNPYEEPGLFRLPRSQSEGHLPRIAVTTGTEDAYECLLRRIGIADSEFTPETGSGRVHLFVGCDGGSGTGTSSLSDELGGAMLSSATWLFSSVENLMRYDYVLLGCEGNACASDKENHTANVQAYADRGGRLMLDHLQRYWLENGSLEWQSIAAFSGRPGTQPSTITAQLDLTFPKGYAFAEWLVNVRASTRVGELGLRGTGASLGAVMVPAQRWLYSPASPAHEDGLGVFLMTMNTPVSALAEQTCGRVVFADFHAAAPGNDESGSSVRFPDGCSTGRPSPEDAALEFQLFDIPGCVQHDIVDPPRGLR